MIRSIKKMFKSNYLFTLGVIICLAWILLAILAPVIAPYDPIAQDLTLRLQAPSAEHLFGTDNFGRDIFSRVIYGGRYSLLPDGGDRGRHRYLLWSHRRLRGRLGGQCNDASLGDDSVFPVPDSGHDHQRCDGFQPVQHHVRSGHRGLAHLRQTHAERCLKRQGK